VDENNTLDSVEAVCRLPKITSLFIDFSVKRRPEMTYQRGSELATQQISSLDSHDNEACPRNVAQFARHCSDAVSPERRLHIARPPLYVLCP
jgi:hypothetical protein